MEEERRGAPMGQNSYKSSGKKRHKTTLYASDMTVLFFECNYLMEMRKHRGRFDS